jgi:hypothetical protein
MSDRKWLFHLRAVPHTALALAVCGSGSVYAQAGNAVTGEVLYRTDVTIDGTRVSCRDCHDAGALGRGFLRQGLEESGVASRISGAIGSNRGGMAAYATWTAQQRADLAAYILLSAAPPPPPFSPPPPPPAVPTPIATPNPALFSSTEVGATSAATGILFTNTSQSTITFASPAVVAVGGATGEFLATVPPGGTPMCGGSLAPGMSCSFGAQFRPTVAGARSVTWVVSFTGGVGRAHVDAGRHGDDGTSAPAPAPLPTTIFHADSDTAPSAANAPTSGGGGGTGWLSLCALGLCAALRRRRPSIQ